MKKTFKLAALSLLSLLLVGCQKTNDSKPSTPSTPKKDVIDDWEEKLKGDIKLEGGVYEKDVVKDASNVESTSEDKWFGVTLAYSSEKCLFQSVAIGDEDSGGDLTLDDYRFVKIKEAGKTKNQAGGEYIDELNTVQISSYGNMFDDICVNPFSRMEYDYAPIEGDEYSFTVDCSTADEDDKPVKELADYLLVSSGSMLGYMLPLLLNDEFTSVVFKEVDSKLSLEFTSDVVQAENSQPNSEGKTLVSSQTILKFDITTEAGEAFENLKPYAETDASKKLDTVLKTLAEKTDYKIHRSSQKLEKNAEKKLVPTSDPKEEWDVFYKGDESYNGRSKNGVTKVGDKHYLYKYNEDDRKIVSTESLEDQLEGSWSEINYALLPDYSISAAIFDSEEKDSVTTYTFKEDLESDVQKQVLYLLQEDNATKYSAYKEWEWSDLSLKLDSNNKLSMEYTLDDKKGSTTLETYTWDSETAVEFPTHVEKIPTKVVGNWEISKTEVGQDQDPETDEYKVNGAKVVVAQDKSKITITKNNADGSAGTPVEVTTFTVVDGVVSFTIPGTDADHPIDCSLELSSDGQTPLLTIGSVGYHLQSDGAQLADAKAKAIAEIEKWDITVYDNDSTNRKVFKLDDKGTTDDDSDDVLGTLEEYANQYKELLKDQVNKATTLNAVDDILDALADGKESVDLAQIQFTVEDWAAEIISLFDSANGQTMQEVLNGTRDLNDCSDAAMVEYYATYMGTTIKVTYADGTQGDYPIYMFITGGNCQSLAQAQSLFDQLQQSVFYYIGYWDLYTLQQWITSGQTLSAHVLDDLPKEITDADKQAITDAKTVFDAVVNDATKTVEEKKAAAEVFIIAHSTIVEKIPEELQDIYLATKQGSNPLETEDIEVSGYSIKIGEEIIIVDASKVEQTDDGTYYTGWKVSFDTKDGKHWILQLTYGDENIITLKEVDESGTAVVNGQVWTLVSSEPEPDIDDGDDSDGSDSMDFHFSDIKLA